MNKHAPGALNLKVHAVPKKLLISFKNFFYLALNRVLKTERFPALSLAYKAIIDNYKLTLANFILEAASTYSGFIFLQCPHPRIEFYINFRFKE